MNREEIYDRACEFAEERINEGMLYDTRTEIRFAFERGAEWMQEQCDEESDKEYNRHVIEEAELRTQLSKVRHDDDVTIGNMAIEIGELRNLVSAKEDMIAQMSERMDELDDKVSELTEALDASHIFCEGVKEHYIKKACEWLRNEYFNGKLREVDGSWFVFELDFMQAMKGE